MNTLLLSKFSYDPIVSLSEVWLYILMAVLILIIGALAFFFGKREKVNHTKAVVYAGVMIALSFALSYVRLFHLPQGGSVTLASLLPLLLYSYAFGARRGVLVGLICGLLQFIQEPIIYHPAQFLLDYPIAFSAIGLSGILFRTPTANKKILRFVLGAVFAGLIRYASHVISGIFVFYVWAPEAYGAVAWGFLYNTFVFADIAIAIALGVVLLGVKPIDKALIKACN